MKRNPPGIWRKRGATSPGTYYVLVVEITRELSIADSELIFRASRSGGPGGQHVNTSSTRIELWWDVFTSPSLSEEQRDRLMTTLASRLTSSGELRLVSSGSRSQLQNRKEVLGRFQELLARAVTPPRRRKKTRPSRAVKERRLNQKKRQATKKALRRRPPEE